MKNITFDSADGKSKIQAYYWTPDGEAKGIVQLIHGMQEHIGRYTDFAEYLVSKGFIVVAHDQLGHGRTAVTEDQLGFVAKEHPSDTLVRDIHRLRTGTEKKFPGLPYFIFGHSMGSYLLRKYVAKYADGLSGVIICGTGNEKPAKAKAGLAVIGALTKKYGPYHRSQAVTKMMFGGPYKEFDMTGTDLGNSWLTKDVTIVQKYYDDRFCTTPFTLNGYNALVSTVIFDSSKEAFRNVPKDLPILIISGDRDPVGNFGKGPKEVYANYVKAGVTDIEIRLFEDDRHEILNELDRSTVYDYIYEWLDSHLI